MAPVPKKRQTKASQRKRRQQQKLKLPHLAACVNCGKPKLPHVVCKHCGKYGKDK